MKRAAVVVNPTKCEEADVRAELTEQLQRAGWEAPLWLPTTAADPGGGMTREAIDQGVDLVLACGGDGTVMACVSSIAATGVPLGVLPLGTGNLLARNLDLPLDLDEALAVALTGAERSIDVASVAVGTQDDAGRRFVVMAGIGFDAAMMADAPEGMKSKVGWPAYVLSGVKHLGDRRTKVELRLDGRPALSRRVHAVIVGNVGRLQGGIALFPEADPADGRLDIAALAPRHLGDWARLTGRLLVRGSHEDDRIERWQAATIEMRAAGPLPVELDGDPVGKATYVRISVEPGALLLRVPIGSERGNS